MRSPPSALRWLVSVLAALICSGGLYGVFAPIFDRQAALLARGAETTGIVTGVDCSPAKSGKTRPPPELTYSFVVNRSPYFGTGGLAAAFAGRCASLRPGTPLTVTFLPTDPTVNLPYPRAALRNQDGRLLILSLTGAIFIIVLIGAHAIQGAAAERRARTRA